MAISTRGEHLRFSSRRRTFGPGVWGEVKISPSFVYGKRRVEAPPVMWFEDEPVLDPGSQERIRAALERLQI